MSKRRKHACPLRNWYRDLCIILKPTNIRGWILLGFFVISFIIVIVTVFRIPPGPWNTVGLSVASSLLAATFVEGTIQVSAKANRLFSKRKFLTVFSHSNEDEQTDQSTIIVIPAFNLGADNESSQDSGLKSKAIENLLQSKTTAAIKNDVVAGAFLASAFPKNNLPTPQISWDEEELEVFDGSSNKERTYILIGLSNNQVEKLNNQKIEQCFRIDTTEENNFNSFYINFGSLNDSNSLQPFDQWIRYPQSTTKNIEYAIFSKLNFGNNTLIVCGGTTEMGTNRIGWYVSEFWGRIYDELGKEKGSRLTPDDSFAVLVVIPEDRNPKNFVIERKCIKKKNI